MSVRPSGAADEGSGVLVFYIRKCPRIHERLCQSKWRLVLAGRPGSFGEATFTSRHKRLPSHATYTSRSSFASRRH